MGNVFQQAQSQMQKHIKTVIAPEVLASKRDEFVKGYSEAVDSMVQSSKFKKYMQSMAYQHLQQAVQVIFDSPAFRKKIKIAAAEIVGGLFNGNK